MLRQALNVRTWSDGGRKRPCLASTVILLAGSLSGPAASQPANSPGPVTQVVMLGTGTPGPDPDRSGPATAIVVNGSAYLVDFGAGVVRRAKAAVIEKGVKALEPTNLRVAFVTHLHSDHTVGYPDLILTPWVIGRQIPLEVYGPIGIKSMTQHILAAYGEDIKARTRPDGNQHTFPQGSWVNAHEIKAGVIYKDANVTVTAFPTKHALESYGYRFDTPDRSIVISGDTAPTQATIDACNGCDVLIHEVNTLAAVAARPLTFQAFAARYHTSTEQLAELASKAKPGLLVLYHASIVLRPGVKPNFPANSSIDELLSEMRSRYTGNVVAARDLDVY
jgi:ribonuclease BN (tRNA processing enzyme)